MKYINIENIDNYVKLMENKHENKTITKETLILRYLADKFPFFKKNYPKHDKE